MTKKDLDTLIETHGDVLKVTADSINNGATPFEVAGVLMATAIHMYKEMLDPDEFEQLLEDIQQTALDYDYAYDKERTIH
tara:strand:+ start:3322 stop:3561 length:240 start_codon:yes stop_codon:yes gene_type:complete